MKPMIRIAIGSAKPLRLPWSLMVLLLLPVLEEYGRRERHFLMRAIRIRPLTDRIENDLDACHRAQIRGHGRLRCCSVVHVEAEARGGRERSNQLLLEPGLLHTAPEREARARNHHRRLEL